jgi:hypothetical protein
MRRSEAYDLTTEQRRSAAFVRSAFPLLHGGAMIPFQRMWLIEFGS